MFFSLGHERRDLKIVFLLVSIFFLTILFYPLLCVLSQSAFGPDGQLTLSHYVAVFEETSFWEALSNSLTVSSLAALTSTVLAFIAAYGLHFSGLSKRLKKGFQIIILLPLFLPSITYGFAVIYSFGRMGLVSQLIAPPPFSIYGFWGLFIANIIYTLPAAFLILYNAFFYIDRHFVIVSHLMGDSPWQTFYITSLRPVVGSLVSAFILCFFLCFTDFGIPISIAGEYRVIATELYMAMMGAIPNFPKGSVIAVVMLIPSVLSIVVLRMAERLNFRYGKVSKADIKPHLLRDRCFLCFYSLLTTGLLLVFLVMFVVPFVRQWPYQPDFTLSVVTRILTDSSVWTVYGQSVWVALLSALFGTILCFAAGLIKARSRLSSWCQTTMDLFAMIANTVPGMVLGIGFLFAMSGTPITNTFTILVLCNLVHFFATPFMMATTAFSKMNAGWETTGALMGDSWIKTIIRVVLPNSKATILQMFSYFFVSSMVTISAVVFLTGAKTMLLTTKIKELQYFEKFEEIFVLSLLIFITNVFVKVLFDALAEKNIRINSLLTTSFNSMRCHLSKLLSSISSKS